ncbi:hypothetical protein [Asaia platycodi]|uniref:hypothetical protein n=1 Tax=Asaia platycodi TaxID=610243 RepID=UPI00054D6D7B|nr:hypothetical protein [Asaia platycodi]
MQHPKQWLFDAFKERRPLLLVPRARLAGKQPAAHFLPALPLVFREILLCDCLEIVLRHDVLCLLDKGTEPIHIWCFTRFEQGQRFMQASQHERDLSLFSAQMQDLGFDQAPGIQGGLQHGR